MATYPFNNAVPNPVDVGVGTKNTGRALPTLASAINNAHARNGGRLISQTFARITGTFWQGLITTVNGVEHEFIGHTGLFCSWLVPQISTAHTNCTLFVQCTRLAGSSGANTDGQVLFKVGATTLATISFGSQMPIGVPQALQFSVTLPHDGGEYNRLEMHVNLQAPTGSGDDDTRINVRSVQLHADQIASPLPAGVAGSSGGEFVPVGQAATASGAPFSAALGKALIDNLNALDKRRKPLLCWGMPRAKALTDNLIRQLYAEDATKTPTDLNLFGTILVRSCPQKLRLRVWAEIEVPSEGASSVVIVASPAGQPLGSHGHHPPGSVSHVVLNVAGAETTVSGYLTVDTPARISLGPAAYIHVGMVSHREAESRFGLRSADAASSSSTQPAIVRSLSIWEDPLEQV